MAFAQETSILTLVDSAFKYNGYEVQNLQIKVGIRESMSNTLVKFDGDLDRYYIANFSYQNRKYSCSVRLSAELSPNDKTLLTPTIDCLLPKTGEVYTHNLETVEGKVGFLVDVKGLKQAYERGPEINPALGNER